MCKSKAACYQEYGMVVETFHGFENVNGDVILQVAEAVLCKE